MRVHRSKYRRLALAVLAGGTLSLVAFATVGGAGDPVAEQPGSKLVPAIDVTKNGKGVTKNSIKIVSQLRDQGVWRQPCDGRYAPRRQRRRWTARRCLRSGSTSTSSSRAAGSSP